MIGWLNCGSLEAACVLAVMEVISRSMSTLTEIEEATTTLSAQEKAELLLFVAGQLRSAQAPLPEPRLFSAEQVQSWMDEDEEDMRRLRAGQ